MKYIKGFDSLRAISIIFVLITHLGVIHLLPESNFIRHNCFQLFSGGTGVRIFFTLSGYLITSILLMEFMKYGKINYKIFFIKRFLRLLPPLVIFYSAIAILMIFGLIRPTTFGFVFSIFYIYNFVPNAYNTGELGHTWSLALEEQFYVIWPFAISLLYPKKRLVSFIYLVLLACLVAIFLFPKIDFLGYFKANRWFIPAVAPVIIGCYFAILNHTKDRTLISFLENRKMALAISIILYASPLILPNVIMKTSIFFQSIGIALLLVWIVNNQSSRITSILDNKPIAYIGKISYGLYVYQGLFLRTNPNGSLWIQQFPQNIILTLITAILSYHFIEKKFLVMKSKFRTNNNQSKLSNS